MSEANPVLETSSAGKANAQQTTALLSTKRRSLWGDVWRRFRRHKPAMFGLIVLILLTLWISFYGLIYVGQLVERSASEGAPFSAANPTLREASDHLNFIALVAPPSANHPFGTDDLGRDLLARTLYGGRISLAVGFAAMLVAISIGTVVGALSGFFGGIVDQLLMRLTDLFLSLPTVPLILLVVYLFKQPVIKAMGSPEAGIFVIVVTMIGCLAWMQSARVVRASFLSLKQKEFVEAAVALGVRRRSIMFRHILPNALSPIIVAATLEIGSAIIAESTLSFLGVGFPADTPTWGRLVTDGSQYLRDAPWLAMIPGFLIFITVLSINFVGDGLRDALDPRSRL